MEQVKVGKLDDKSAIGPVASKAQFDKIQGLLQKGIDEGATVVVGGPGRPGRALGTRLLRQAHGVRRRHQRHDDRARGDLRAGAVQSSDTTTSTRRWRSPTTPNTGWRATFRPPISTKPERWLARFAPGPWRSTTPST